jgi:hypothetical protein
MQQQDETEEAMCDLLKKLQSESFQNDIAESVHVLKEIGKVLALSFCCLFFLTLILLQRMFPPLPHCCTRIGSKKLHFVSPTDVIIDHYKWKVGINDEEFIYKKSATIQHPCNTKCFKQCEWFVSPKVFLVCY